MTKGQFAIANFFKKLGIQKKQKRLNDAATELQLLREAEDLLGRKVWRNTENLDNYKVNYWNLRKLEQKRKEVEAKLQAVQEKIMSIKENKRSKFQSGNSGDMDLSEMLSKQSLRVKDLKEKQDDITRIAGNIRRLYDGTVLKLQALQEEGASADLITKEEQNIGKLKKQFADLKTKKIECDAELDKQKSILKKISDSISSRKTNYRDEASENYEIIGKANKALSTYRSQLGVIDGRIMEHYSEVGKNLSKEYFTDKVCREAAGENGKLCQIMLALRQSIDYNHILADR